MQFSSPPLSNGRPVLWFQDVDATDLFINETAVRIRAGIMLALPLFMAYTLLDALYGSKWVVTGEVITDTFETDFDGHILYMVQAIRRTYDYSLQTALLFYGLFEMLAGMNVWLARLSPTIHLANWLARKHPKVWMPLAPKRFAWSIGVSLMAVCLVFFNPDTFATAVNAVARAELLPTTRNYMPRWIPLTLVWVCLGFMWLEAILGYCVGCKIHALLVKLGVFEAPCEACNNLDFSAKA